MAIAQVYLEMAKSSVGCWWAGEGFDQGTLKGFVLFFPFILHFFHFFWGGGGRILLYRSGWPQTHPSSSPSVFQAMGLQLCAVTPGASRFFSVKMDVRWGSSILSLSLTLSPCPPFSLSPSFPSLLSLFLVKRSLLSTEGRCLFCWIGL